MRREINQLVDAAENDKLLNLGSFIVREWKESCQVYSNQYGLT